MLILSQAESALFLVQDHKDSQTQINSITPQPETFDISDTNIILRSSEFVNFRVHKSVLAMASEHFKDILVSHPQSFNSEIVDGLPVLQLFEDSELLNGLVSILYHHPVIPSSYDKVSYFLTTYQ
jgi:hypothetical protein